MIAKFNPTGTHVHKGFLKVRVDLYPKPTDKTYPIHHVQVPVIPPEGYQGKVDDRGNSVDQADYNSWIDSLPKVWQLNPALCHFINIKADTTALELNQMVKGLFDKDTLSQLDNLLSQPVINLKGVIKLKIQVITDKVVSADIDTINLRLSSLEVKV